MNTITIDQIRTIDPYLPDGPKAPPAMVAYVKQVSGMYFKAYDPFTTVPWTVYAMAEIGGLPLAYIDHNLAHLIGLVVAQDNSCRYCYGAARSVLTLLGHSQDEINQWETDLAHAEMRPRDRAALEFARRLSRFNPAPGPKDRQTLLDLGWSDDQIDEIILETVHATWNNRMMTLAAIAPDAIEDTVKAWYAPILKPIMGLVIKSTMMKQAKPKFFAPNENIGPFASILARFDGKPGAQRYRAAFDRAWASDVLSKRCKALIVAVVARSLGDKVSETEAVTLLKAEGMSDATIQEVLATLASPQLDALESRLVAIARETIRYETQTIQKRMRELATNISNAQLIEAIAIYSMANTVARMSAASKVS